jgi:hypothetical protein
MIPARIVGCKRLPSSPQKNWRVRGRAPFRSKERELASERWRERLSTRLAALAAADEQRRTRPFELEVGPVERDQLRPPQTRLDEGEQDEPVPLGEARASPGRVLGGGEEACELLLRQPVRLLLRLRRRLEIEERIGRPASPAEPPHEAAQESEAAVVGRGRGLGSPLVVGQVVDDRRLVEDAAITVAAPGQDVVDRGPVGGDRARFAWPPGVGAATRRGRSAGPARAPSATPYATRRGAAASAAWTTSGRRRKAA